MTHTEYISCYWCLYCYHCNLSLCSLQVNMWFDYCGTFTNKHEAISMWFNLLLHNFLTLSNLTNVFFAPPLYCVCVFVRPVENSHPSHTNPSPSVTRKSYTAAGRSTVSHQPQQKPMPSPQFKRRQVSSVSSGSVSTQSPA